MPDQVQTCFSEAILAEISHLRAYARLMTNDVSSADREVTETLKRALSNIEGLCNRTGLRVKLLTILRNILVIGEAAPGRLKALSAIYERLKAPFRIVANGHPERPDSLATALLRLNFGGPGSRRPTSRCESVSRGSGENHWLRAARIRRKSAEWLRAPGRTPSKANAHDLCRGSDCKLFWRCKCLPRILWDK
jgi:hypothetical protein